MTGFLKLKFCVLDKGSKWSKWDKVSKWDKFEKWDKGCLFDKSSLWSKWDKSSLHDKWSKWNKWDKWDKDSKFLNPHYKRCKPPPCFVAGTLVTTRRGEIPVEQVRAGDMLRTLDNGWQKVVWAGGRVLTPAQLQELPDYAPIRIAAGAFGPDAPRRDVMVSPQHRVLVRHAHAELLFGEAEVLVAAKHLLGRPGISRCDNSAPVHYVHLLCEGHEVLQTEGIWSESFQPGDMTSVAWDKEQRQELWALFPQLPAVHGTRAARPSLKQFEAAALFATGAAAA